MSFSFERHAIDRIYETSDNVAKRLRRIAEDIEREVERAKANEGSDENFRTTYEDLPGAVVNLVVQGIANAQLDSPARQLRELMIVRNAERKRALPLAERLRSFAQQWQRNPQNSEKIYSLAFQRDGEDVVETIDVELFEALANYIDPKGA